MRGCVLGQVGGEAMRGIECRTGAADHDAEHGERENPGVTGPEMEEVHAEGSDAPGQDGDDNNADGDGRPAIGNSEDDLTTQNAIDHAVAKHRQNVEKAADLAWVVTEKVSRYHQCAMTAAWSPGTHVGHRDTPQYTPKDTTNGCGG